MTCPYRVYVWTEFDSPEPKEELDRREGKLSELYSHLDNTYYRHDNDYEDDDPRCRILEIELADPVAFFTKAQEQGLAGFEYAEKLSAQYTKFFGFEVHVDFEEMTD